MYSRILNRSVAFLFHFRNVDILLLITKQVVQIADLEKNVSFEKIVSLEMVFCYQNCSDLL